MLAKPSDQHETNIFLLGNCYTVNLSQALGSTSNPDRICWNRIKTSSFLPNLQITSDHTVQQISNCIRSGYGLSWPRPGMKLAYFVYTATKSTVPTNLGWKVQRSTSIGYRKLRISSVVCVKDRLSLENNLSTSL